MSGKESRYYFSSLDGDADADTPLLAVVFGWIRGS
jgi:hypothetical protein